MANLVNLLNPKYVILTGDMLEYQQLFLGITQETARKAAWSFSNTAILISAEGKQRAAIGAALYFINEAFEDQHSPLICDWTGSIEETADTYA
ncbi:MAG: ROK family protein [Lachnospiraceae bacterium]|nr:ROK family protein [Lachnospiraceae bacterium]